MTNDTYNKATQITQGQKLMGEITNAVNVSLALTDEQKQAILAPVQQVKADLDKQFSQL